MNCAGGEISGKASWLRHQESLSKNPHDFPKSRVWCMMVVKSQDRGDNIILRRKMSFAALPAVVTPALLSSIRSHPDLPLHTWYFIAGVTLSMLNRPDEIQKVFKCALEEGLGRVARRPQYDEQLNIARKMREALVKAAPIGGLPKV